MSDTSGQSSQDAFAYYDRKSSSWKTSQLTFDSDSTEFSGILPKWGSLQDGVLSTRPTWEPPTSARDSSLLPTPAAQEPGGTAENFLRRKNRDGHNRTVPTHLAHIVKLLPTPSASDDTGGEGPTRSERQKKGTGGPSLRDVGHLLPRAISPTKARSLLPTPTSQDAKHGTQNVDEAERNPHTMWATIKDLLPTPTTQDGENLGGPAQHERNTLPLNARVQALSGATTNPPSDAGSRSPESPHPDQLTIEDA
jgi:hypothetical protein